MALASDLLEQAEHLAHRERTRPKQASLRRSVSTAYYALFHLLIADAVKNWKRNDQRDALARAFSHGRMKAASERTARDVYAGANPAASEDLKRVAQTFTELQQYRHLADYDNSEGWSRTEVLDRIHRAKEAFASWRRIRHEQIAQDYLLSLLVDRR